MAGASLLAGPQVALLGRFADRFGPTGRIVVRDLARNRARAGAAVAAAMIVLAMPVAAGAALAASTAYQSLNGLPADGDLVSISASFAQGDGGPADVPDDVIDRVRSEVPGVDVATTTTYQQTLGPDGVVAPGDLRSTTTDALPVPHGIAAATPELLDLLDGHLPDTVTADDAGQRPMLLGVTNQTRTLDVLGQPVEIREVPARVPADMPRLLVSTTLARPSRPDPGNDRRP